MQKRNLGKNGPKVGAIGLGCMSFAGFYGKTDEAESHRTLARALDLGVDHLDIANIYGQGVAEQVVGSFIKNNPNSFKIATKAGIKLAPERGYDNSPQYLAQCLEESFARLRVDYVDLFYIHRREQERPIEDVTETLAGFVKQGKIGGFGFSEISPGSLERASAVHHVMAVQSEYSLWTRLPELGMIQACKRFGTAFVAFSPLARGMLTGVMPAPDKLADTDFRKNQPRFNGVNFKYNVEKISRFNAYAVERGLTPEALALAWCLHQGDHIIPIPGTRSSEHLENDAAAADIVLSKDDMAKIEDLLPVGFAHGDRYTVEQYNGPERYC